MNKVWKIILVSLITLAIGFLSFYITMPAINVQSEGFWGFLLFLVVVWCFFFGIFMLGGLVKEKKFNKDMFKTKGFLIAVAVPLAVIILGGISSAKIFNAARYSSLITVNEAVFEDDMKETTSFNNIALMDSESAAIIGKRALGNLSEVVSQYNIGDSYTQINYKNTPQKVANLEYAGFFKWINNRSAGIPGYVMVDPVNNTSDYIKFQTPMKYTESGYFGDNLYRKLRFSYPTKIFDSVYFEIDDEGNPYYIVSCLKANAGLFGAKDVKEAIIFDPCTGESKLYKLKDIPSWVDTVFTGDLATQKYNWYGTLSGGYFNSIIGNKNCRQTTDDYGYIVIDDDVWYFTGVTSVTNDESNIGFILSNARTGEYKYYSVVGAEEYSAMAAAEGEVQEKGYQASFPSLINVEGNPTYIMVLKDSGGLVKLYAAVNVEQYNIVTTAATQA